MKCRGCKWQSKGVSLTGEKILYCIGAPDSDPKYGAESLITKDRIIKVNSGCVYRANDDDECHLWFSERFNNQQPRGGA